MKAVTRNPDAINRYIEAFEETATKIENGDIKLTENDGQLSRQIVEEEKFIREYVYVTASGKGQWYIHHHEGSLAFEGHRESFRNGSSLLGWQPKRVDGWAVEESSHSERGAFEDKKSFYKRKYRNWAWGSDKQPEFIEMMKIDNIEEPSVQETIKGFKRSIAVVDAGDDEHILIYDRRDVPTEWRIDGTIIGRNVHKEMKT